MTILEKPRKNHFSMIGTGRKWLACNECSYEKVPGKDHEDIIQW